MRMRTKLLLALFAVSFGLSAVSLIVTRSTLERQIRRNLFSDLQHSVLTFENLQAQRRQTLDREASLIADLPSLKALMTTSHEQTIQDAGEEFWHVSGMDLFALADRSGKIVAVYGAGAELPQTESEHLLQGMLGQQPGQHLVVIARRLFEVAFEPLYFGPESSDTTLGYVAIGYAIDDRVAREVSDTASADVIFAANGVIVSSTLNAEHRLAAAQSGLLTRSLRNGEDVWLGKEHYLAASLSLSGGEQGNVHLIVLKSYDAARVFVRPAESHYRRHRLLCPGRWRHTGRLSRAHHHPSPRTARRRCRRAGFGRFRV